jgi:hypothetical protein
LRIITKIFYTPLNTTLTLFPSLPWYPTTGVGNVDPGSKNLALITFYRSIGGAGSLVSSIS